MEQMVEPPPPEGDEATITAMSPLAIVGQYLSTNSAKSTFLRNTEFVVKAISSNRLMIKICKLKTMLYLRSKHKTIP